MRTRLSTAGVLVLLALVACARIQIGGLDREQKVNESLRAAVSGPAPAYTKHDPEGARLWKLTRSFYQKRGFTAAWARGARARPEMEALVRAIRAAGREGLDPELYNVGMLDARYAEATKGFLTEKGFDPREAGVLDVWLTYLYMKYASDLADGFSNLSHADGAWKIKPETFDARAHLENALSTGRIEESLAELTPGVPEYQRLRDLLARYREQKARGGWPRLPAMKLKPGQKSPHVAALARRLAASGDYTGPVPAPSNAAVYGPELQESVKRFQRRHGLSGGAAVGPEVVAALNVPLDRRLDQVALNMERWRWLPRKLGPRYILVNIPEMRLDVYEGDQVPLSMRVVVGKPDSQTPIFNDEMTHVVFSPYWNVPPGIAEGETLPAIMSDPTFLARNNMEVLDQSGDLVDPSSMDLSDPAAYRFRQRPGADNSLGLVKFMFPNQYSVYLHDTPAGSLFDRATRSFSHGCVRVEDPVALAAYVLRDQPGWDRQRIQDAMHAGDEKTVGLKSSIPVYLGYWTARVRADGAAQFRKDVYDIDRRLAARLADRLRRLKRMGEAAAAATTISS